jgi:hypothetical protein
MKKISSMLLAFPLMVLFVSYNQHTEKNDFQNASRIATGDATSVEGAWQLVWGEYNGQVADTSNRYIFKTFNNGVFSLIAYDSTKKITFAGYGKHEFEGDTYHETFMYHNNPKYIGAANWQDLTVKGDTMYLNGFKKIVVGGQDVTTGWRKAREKLVRVKW